MGSPKRSGAVGTAVNVAEAKRRFSDLLGRVAYAGETVLITRRGRAMARLVPVREAEERRHLGSLQGWLDDEDPYFDIIEKTVRARRRRRPRVWSRKAARFGRR